MKREFLEKLGLEKEVIDEIMKENGQDIQSEKEKLADKEKELSQVKGQLEELNNDMKKYQDMDIEQIKANALEWEGKYTKLEEDMTAFKKSTRLEKALSETNTHDVDMLLKAIDQEGLEFEDEEIKGLDEQIQTLKEDKPFLFKEDKKEDDRFQPFKPTPSDKPDTKSDIEALIDQGMNY